MSFTKEQVPWGNLTLSAFHVPGGVKGQLSDIRVASCDTVSQVVESLRSQLGGSDVREAAYNKEEQETAWTELSRVQGVAWAASQTLEALFSDNISYTGWVDSISRDERADTESILQATDALRRALAVVKVQNDICRGMERTGGMTLGGPMRTD